MKSLIPKILIADDQLDVLEALRLLLKAEDYRIESVASPARVLEALKAQDFDVLLMDLNYARDTTSGQEGLDLLREIQRLDATLPVVVMTAWGNVELAVEAIRRGARDFVQKPWENERLLTILRTQTELGRALRNEHRLEAENQLLRDGARTLLPPLIAEAAVMRPVRKLIERVGPSTANVLVTGENGTGKEVVARHLHALSERSLKPLIIVNAGALSEGIFESELFGHVRGAFTDARADRVGRFELADGGTLFLDEIATVPLNLQPKLLRVLETGEFEPVGASKTRRVDVRVISATNASLQMEVAAGRFRQDLFFRLNTVEIHLPPLRERREDIPLLAEHFLRQHAARYRKQLSGFEKTATEALLNRSWPGNIRELQHSIERASLMAQASLVSIDDLGLQSVSDSTRRLEEMSLEEVESILIRKALARFDGNVNQAAAALGLSRSALYRRINKYGL
jgi:DNA-binding NtrC family response regulator